MNTWQRISLIEFLLIVILGTMATVFTFIALQSPVGFAEANPFTIWTIRNFGYVGSWFLDLFLTVMLYLIITKTSAWGQIPLLGVIALGVLVIWHIWDAFSDLQLLVNAGVI